MSRVSSRRKRELYLFFKIFLVALVIGVLLATLITNRITASFFRNKYADLETTIEDLQNMNTILRDSVQVVNRFTGGTVEESAEDDWKLRLVNGHFQLPLDFMPDLAEIENGMQLDVRIIETTNAMLNAMREVGLDPYIVSAYRSTERQVQLLNTGIQARIDQGYLPFDAFAAVNQKLALPGSSEHALGLALDIGSSAYTTLEGWTTLLDEWNWLAENSWQFGFILRYPAGQSQITGVAFEPWHFRYVGVEAATEIFERGITLEEFLGIVQPFVNIDPNAGNMNNNQASGEIIQGSE